MSRLLCLLGRHRSVLVIDDVDLISVGPTTVQGRIRSSHRECRRCHRRLP